jgi:hypothetical protein
MSNSTPIYRCTKTNRPQMPGRARTANGGDATVPMTAATHAPHIPGPDAAAHIAVRDAAAHRCARRRVSTAPVTDSERLRASLADSDRPQHPPVRVNRTACESALREAQPAQAAQLQKFEGQVRFNFEKSQQHLGGADYTRTAAVRCCVYASLAPAQPPPPAGLASGLPCM